MPSTSFLLQGPLLPLLSEDPGLLNTTQWVYHDGSLLTGRHYPNLPRKAPVTPPPPQRSSSLPEVECPAPLASGAGLRKGGTASAGAPPPSWNIWEWRLALQLWLAGRQLCALPVLGWQPASLGGHLGGAGTFPCELTLKPGDSQVQLPAWTYWLSRTFRLMKKFPVQPLGASQRSTGNLFL